MKFLSLPPSPRARRRVVGSSRRRKSPASSRRRLSILFAISNAYSSSASGIQEPVAFEDEGDARLDRYSGRIEHHRVGCGLERCGRPAHVARVALADIAQKTVNINRVSFFDQLLISASRPLLRGGGHIDLEYRIREN